MGEERAVSHFACEFFGAYLVALAFAFGGIVQDRAYAGVIYGCAVAALTYAMGRVSHGHFNPAITIAATMTRNLSLLHAFMYLVMHFIGAFAGVCTYLLFFDLGVKVEPAEGYDIWHPLAVEGLFTCFVAFVHLNTLHAKVAPQHAGKTQTYGLAMGCAVFAAHSATSPISRGFLNPALAIGIDIPPQILSKAFEAPVNSCLYMAAQVSGGFLAGVLFLAVRPSELSSNIAFRLAARVYSKLLGEFIGTFMLVVTLGLTVLQQPAIVPWAAACLLLSLGCSLGATSGAHFNPAVTVASVCACRPTLSLSEGFLYLVTQAGAAFAGAVLVRFFLSGATFPLKPAGYRWDQILASESAFTFVLCFAHVSVSVMKKSRVLSDMFGLAQGFAFLLGGLSIGKISGGWLNPAVSLAITGAREFEDAESWSCLYYVSAQLGGGVLAAVALLITQPSEFCSRREAEVPFEDECTSVRIGKPSDDVADGSAEQPDDDAGEDRAEGRQPPSSLPSSPRSARKDVSEGKREKSDWAVLQSGGGHMSRDEDEQSNAPSVETVLGRDGSNAHSSLEGISLLFAETPRHEARHEPPWEQYEPPKSRGYTSGRAPSGTKSDGALSRYSRGDSASRRCTEGGGSSARARTRSPLAAHDIEEPWPKKRVD